MNERRQNLIVGLFALGGLTVLGVLVMMFGDVLTFLTMKTYNVRVEFAEGASAAIREGTAVTLNGKRVGQTKSIEFITATQPADGVYVNVAIDDRYGLPDGTTAAVLTSLMGFGRPALQLVVTREIADKPELPRDGTARIPGKLVPMLDQLLPQPMQTTLNTASGQIGRLAEALTPVAADMHRLLDVRTIDDVDREATQKLSANLYTAVQRLDVTLKSLNLMVGNPDNRENFAAAVANIRRTSEDFAVLTKDLRNSLSKWDQTLDTVQTNVDSTGRKLANVADSADRLLGTAERTFLLMNEGKGTAGLFLNDNRLYESMVLTTDRLSRAIDEIREILSLMKKGELKYRVF